MAELEAWLESYKNSLDGSKFSWLKSAFDKWAAKPVEVKELTLKIKYDEAMLLSYMIDGKPIKDWDVKTMCDRLSILYGVSMATFSEDEQDCALEWLTKAKELTKILKTPPKSSKKKKLPRDLRNIPLKVFHHEGDEAFEIEDLDDWEEYMKRCEKKPTTIRPYKTILDKRVGEFVSASVIRNFRKHLKSPEVGAKGGKERGNGQLSCALQSFYSFKKSQKVKKNS